MSSSPARLLAAARRGIATVDLPRDMQTAAAAHLEDWLEADKFAGLVSPSAYTPILQWMVEAEEFDLLADSFYQVIPFGTGGRRGPVGVGPNRINPYTIASSVQGHVEYMRQRFPATADLRVAIAYDVRRFHDLRGTYPTELENPLLGLGSDDLARVAAAVYAASGVTVLTAPATGHDYVSTPELSFLIRHLGCHGGVNVSASHNHPDDNGSKFYNGEGGQEIPPDDEDLASIVERVREIRILSDREAAASGLVHDIPGEARQAYIDMNLAIPTRNGARAGRFISM